LWVPAAHGQPAAPAAPPARDASGLPVPLREVGFDQNIGAMLPLDVTFHDETGATVALGQYFGSRPVLLSLVYYECPMLCSMALNGLVSSLRVLDLEPGRDFDIVTVSFNPREDPALAAAKKAKYVEEYERPQAATAWHFLTGDSLAIHQLTETVGFRYIWDEKTRQYAHASGVVVVTPAGQLARYFFGIEYSARDLRLGLVEASAGKLGTVVDQALLYCFRYDPESGTYAAAALNLVRAGGAITVVGVAALILLLRRRDRRRPQAT
jgi:protein SCO1/2